MNPELVDIRQTVRRVNLAVIAKIHEPLRPAARRRPPMQPHVEVLKQALDRLMVLMPIHIEPPKKRRPRLAAPLRRKLVVQEPAWLENIAPMPHDPGEREQEITGCKMLLLEIIRRAAYDWVLYRQSRKMVNLVLAEHAFTWIFQETPAHKDWTERISEGKELTSFVAICEHLDLEPELVRRYVRRLEPKNVMSVGRPAEYRNHDSTPAENVMVGVNPELVDDAFNKMARLEEGMIAPSSWQTWHK